jgi:hypothetical protein
VPFNPFRKKADQAAPAAPAAAASARGGSARAIPFEGLTEEWRLVGVMHLTGRLSDSLNRREAIDISDVTWAPADGSAGFEPAPGLRSVDPYDLIGVLTSRDSLPVLTDAEKAAHKVHKIAYDVGLEAPPYRFIGTVYLYPGSEPERILERATEMFLPVTDAIALLGERQLTDEPVETILVNRFYLRGVEQIDRRTMTRPVPLPGQPLGGTSWQEKSR